MMTSSQLRCIFLAVRNRRIKSRATKAAATVEARAEAARTSMPDIMALHLEVGRSKVEDQPNDVAGLTDAGCTDDDTDEEAGRITPVDETTADVGRPRSIGDDVKEDEVNDIKGDATRTRKGEKRS